MWILYYKNFYIESDCRLKFKDFILLANLCHGILESFGNIV